MKLITCYINFKSFNDYSRISILVVASCKQAVKIGINSVDLTRKYSASSPSFLIYPQLQALHVEQTELQHQRKYNYHHLFHGNLIGRDSLTDAKGL